MKTRQQVTSRISDVHNDKFRSEFSDEYKAGYEDALKWVQQSKHKKER